MAAQFGGFSRSAEWTRAVKDMGFQVLAAADTSAQPYTWDFHLLADQKTVNAFALPGGQVFITEALLSRLETPGQLAGVLGHEAGHVLARHSSEQMAKTKLAQGLSTSAVIAGSDSQRGAYTSAAIAQFVGQFALMKYSREHELEADLLGVRLMTKAGYDPNSLKDVMVILAKASGRSPGASDFMATHPSSERRIQEIDEAIRTEFPEGLPAGLQK
jgi:beta-barrel assembly-enhancing protease